MKEDQEMRSVQRSGAELEAQGQERIKVALLILIWSLTINRLLCTVTEDEYSTSSPV